MGFLGSVTSIIDKLFPNRKRRDVSLETRLICDLAEALKDGRDTDAATIRKQLKTLREEMAYSETD